MHAETNSGNKTGKRSELLMDNSSYMMQYADTMDKLQKIENENLSAQEQEYYIEVMARIQKKLLEAVQ